MKHSFCKCSPWNWFGFYARNSSLQKVHDSHEIAQKKTRTKNFESICNWVTIEWDSNISQVIKSLSCQCNAAQSSLLQFGSVQFSASNLCRFNCFDQTILFDIVFYHLIEIHYVITHVVCTYTEDITREIGCAYWEICVSSF